jgi:hypothetical protein
VFDSREGGHGTLDSWEEPAAWTRSSASGRRWPNAWGGDRPAPAPQYADAAAPADRPQLPQHCWVLDAPETPPGQWPGILLGWARGSSGWIVLALIAAQGDHGMITMQAWVEAEHLQQADHQTRR